MTPYIRPTTLGDVAAYTFFGFGGLFIGGETGVLTGGASAEKTISSDPKSRESVKVNTYLDVVEQATDCTRPA